MGQPHTDSASTADAATDSVDLPPETKHQDTLLGGARTLKPRNLGILLLVTGTIGWLSAFALTLDKLKLLEDPDAKLGCDFNPFFSCGSVMTYPQSAVFGFPNPLIGVAAFVVPIVIGVALIGGVRLPRWIWLGLNAGVFLGAVFITWLFVQSIFVIGVGCPWCIVVWAMQIPMFVMLTLHNVVAGNFGAAVQKNSALRTLAGSPWSIVVLWYAIIAASIVAAFWPWFSSLI
ncbi:vitamin K epoxide reductase family protein [Saxibacter everestensis]|uniref:Vitamin K epoxide reductase family protein n=1 Tax=Saxibacter everestensis TaxID=2909229 RepID=A0ABY8R0I2_9MICO|nr:vitamin K epoxide reductase family protein [Brevibacteriaceae bacterium ZFBP1038]